MADVTNVDPKLINPSNAIVVVVLHHIKENPITVTDRIPTEDHILLTEVHQNTLVLKIAMFVDKLDIFQGFLDFFFRLFFLIKFFFFNMKRLPKKLKQQTWYEKITMLQMRIGGSFIKVFIYF